MNDLRAKFLRELVDFIRSKLNAHLAMGGGLNEFVNSYLRIPCNDDQAGRDLIAQSLASRRGYLEEVISCPLFSVQIIGLVLDEAMKPVWTLIIHPTFNSINQSVIEYFELEVHGHGYKLLDVRERAPMSVDATGWSIVLNELRIESTMDALKRTEPPAG